MIADMDTPPLRQPCPPAVCICRHRELLDGVSCTMAQAILRFFDTWQPEKAAQSPALQEHFDDLCKGGNLLFCLINELAAELAESETLGAELLRVD